MRDRLIELIRQPIPIIKGYATVGETRMSIVDAEKIADRLLANGVVIIDPQKYPPVNNQRIIKTVLGVSLDEMAELIDAKQEGRIIVPPCKVGDMVYMITPNGNIRNLTILSIDIELEEKEITMACLAVYEFEGNPCYLQIHSFKFGKTVFLTREEAEKALKEAKG